MEDLNSILYSLDFIERTLIRSGGIAEENMARDISRAKDALRQLERERERIKRVRDAAVKDIEDVAPCFACIRFERNGGDCIGAHVCEDDIMQEALGGRYADYYFEWRGVQEVE